MMSVLHAAASQAKCFTLRRLQRAMQPTLKPAYAVDSSCRLENLELRLLPWGTTRSRLCSSQCSAGEARALQSQHLFY